MLQVQPMQSGLIIFRQWKTHNEWDCGLAERLNIGMSLDAVSVKPQVDKF